MSAGWYLMNRRHCCVEEKAEMVLRTLIGETLVVVSREINNRVVQIHLNLNVFLMSILY